MTKTKLTMSVVLTVSLLLGQAGTVLAAPSLQESAPISGTVQSITLETDPHTGITTVIVEVIDPGQVRHMLRIRQRTAEGIGLIVPDGDGNPMINQSALGKPISIEPDMVIGEQQPDRHPVGEALATFFCGDLGAENDTLYGLIMEAHTKGISFATIAQALWLTQQIQERSSPENGGNLAVFKALLAARESGNYAGFTYVDESGTIVIPKNWGQLRKAVLEHRKIGKSSGATSNRNNENNKDNENSRDKNNNAGKDKTGTGHEKDKEKEK